MGASTTTSGIIAACLLLAPALIHAYELTENLSASVLAAASVQCQALSRGTADACRGGAPVQAELSLQLTSTDTFQM